MKTFFKFAAISFVLTAFAFSNLNAQFIVSGAFPAGVNGPYSSLTLANGVFDALNTATGGTITVEVVNNSLAETGAISLNATGVWTSVTILPFGGAWTISGTPPAGTPLLNLNGADNVTIDGLNTGGNSLTLSNGSTLTTSGTCVIRFINGATSNVVTRCSLLSSNLVPLGTAGGTVVFSTDANTANGNDNNTISFCDLGPVGQSLPIKHIFSLGTNTSAAIRNSGNVIQNNNIFDFFGTGAASNAAINILAGNDDWTISDNKIYQTAARTFTATALRYSGIVINGGGTLPGVFSISGNIIGFGNSSSTGTTTISGSSNEIRGIDMPSVNPATPTNVQGNIISGINQTSSRASTAASSAGFIGIAGGYITDGRFHIGDITGNQIGSTDGSSTIVINASSTTANTAPVLGIYEFGDGASKVSNNQIGYITINQGAGPAGTSTGFIGIDMTTVVIGTPTEIMENVIDNITNNLIGNYFMHGITVFGKPGYFYKNTVSNYTGNSNSGAASVMAGMSLTLTAGTSTVEKNEVFFMTNNVNNSFLKGISGYSFTFPVNTPNVVKQNYCYGLYVNGSNTGCIMVGMRIFSPSTVSVYNNMITLGLKPDGTSITTASLIIGIEDFHFGNSATKEFYYNTVYITGSGVAAGGSNSFCMNSGSTGTRVFKNNIFWNDRSNAVGGGTSHYAVSYAGAIPNPPGLASDYNNLLASGTDGVLGLYNATARPNLLAWQTATSQDANSSSVPVSFFNPAAGNLHLDGSSVGDEDLIGTPIPGIDTDIDKQLRDLEFPYMGADEGSEPLPVELASFTSSVNVNNVDLIWSTTAELNNAGFDIERSAINGSWSKISNVAGNGTTTTAHSYSYTDRNLASGNYNYRLKQIDFNGNFEYFNLSNEVNVGIPSKFDLSQNYPNPFNPSTNLEFGITELGFVSLKVYDASGKEVATLVNEIKPAGYYSVNFNGSGFSSGVYFYRLSAGDFTATKKMTLIK